MPLNTDPARYPQTGHCLIRNQAEIGLLQALRDDILAAIAEVKANPANAGKLSRWHRDFATELHMKSPRVAAYLQGPPFRDLVRGLLGHEADLRFTSTMTKTAEKNAHLDWHQDSAYARDPEHGMFSFWIAMTDSRRDNGCLRIVPGSHSQGLVPHIPSRTLEFDKEIPDVDEGMAEDVEMEPGDMLLIHRHLFHASWPNRSGRLRMGLIAGFQPSKPDGDYLEFERKGAYRYLRDGRPCWSPIADPA